MHTIDLTQMAIRNEVVTIISDLKNYTSERILQARDFIDLELDIVDVVDIILEVEKRYDLVIPDEVPVYSIEDVVHYVCSQRLQEAC